MTAAAPAHRTSRLLCLAVAGVVVLAVALGVGLGVGLKHQHGASKDLSTSNTSSSTTNSSADLPSLVSQDSSAFFLRGAASMAAEPPQDRMYSFVLEERIGAPDGFEKSMLVVNGWYPGAPERLSATAFSPSALTISCRSYHRGQRGRSHHRQCHQPHAECHCCKFRLRPRRALRKFRR